MASRRVPRFIETGSRAPDFRLPRLEGGEASLKALIAQRPILLAFFKVNCPVCQLTFPHLDRLHAGGTLTVYGVSQNDAEDTNDFNRHFKIHMPMLLDTEESGFPASNAYGISTVPTMFLIERDGTVSRAIEGWRKKEIVSLGAQVEGNVPEWKAG